jgi:hypothetical protein
VRKADDRDAAAERIIAERRTEVIRRDDDERARREHVALAPHQGSHPGYFGVRIGKSHESKLSGRHADQRNHGDHRHRGARYC